MLENQLVAEEICLNHGKMKALPSLLQKHIVHVYVSFVLDHIRGAAKTRAKGERDK